MPRNISLWQILIIVLIIVILFGARRLPDVASSIGKSLKIFKKEVSELREGEDPGPETRDTPRHRTQSAAGPPDGSTRATASDERRDHGVDYGADHGAAGRGEEPGARR